MWKLPIQVPDVSQIRVTQRYGRSSFAIEPKGPNGEPHFHYGLDIARRTPMETYGTAVIMPFPHAELVNYVDPLPGTNGQRFATFRYVSPAGTQFDLVLVHLSAIVFRASYTQGDVVGYVGNSGLVSPTPQIATPFAGSHLHIGLKANGSWVDPEREFSTGLAFIGPDTSVERDLPAWRWALLRAQELLAKLIASRAI